jgi:hypothetical protein
MESIRERFQRLARAMHYFPGVDATPGSHSRTPSA